MVTLRLPATPHVGSDVDRRGDYTTGRRVQMGRGSDFGKGVAEMRRASSMMEEREGHWITPEDGRLSRQAGIRSPVQMGDDWSRSGESVRNVRFKPSDTVHPD